MTVTEESIQAAAIEAANIPTKTAAQARTAVRVPIEPFKTDDEYFRDAMQILAPPSPENCQSCRQPNCDFCVHEPLAKVIGLLKTRDRLLARLFRMDLAKVLVPKPPAQQKQ